MAWTDDFNDVAWANGDYLSEIKLDQMVANERWAYDQLSVTPMPVIVCPDRVPAADDLDDTYEGVGLSPPVGYWRMRLVIDVTAIWNSADYQSASYRSESAVNIGSSVLGGITNGTLFSIILRWERSSSPLGSYTLYGSRSISVAKTQVINYLRIGFDWCIGEYEVSSSSSFWRARVKNFSLIASRASQSW